MEKRSAGSMSMKDAELLKEQHSRQAGPASRRGMLSLLRDGEASMTMAMKVARVVAREAWVISVRVNRTW